MKLAVVPATCALTVGLTCTAHASPTPFVFNGPVTTVAHGGSFTYVAGAFSNELRATGGGVIVNAPGHGTAKVLRSPLVRGHVEDAASDGNGGWYIAGPFERVGGLARPGIAHVRADGSVDADWAPARGADVVGPNVLLVGRDAIYVRSTNGAPPVALDRRTGRVLPWDPAPDGYVTSMAAANRLIYMSGSFTHIGGQARDGLAAIDGSGHATPWAPDAPGATVLAATPTAVYITGNFSHIGTAPRNGLAALDPDTGQATSWNPRAVWEQQKFPVRLRTGSRTVYVTGPFSQIGGQRRHEIAALDARSGSATRWRANVGEHPEVKALTGSAVVVTDGATPTPREISRTTGRSTDWKPEVGTARDGEYAIGVSGGRVYIGGTFDGAGPVAGIRSLARLRADGSLDTSWRPELSGCPRPSTYISPPCISGIAATATAVYVGGTFTKIGGRPRRGLAAISTKSSGRPLTWNPQHDALATPVAAAGRAVYVRGRFSRLGGRSRTAGFAALDASSGRATAWNPRPDGTIRHLVPAGPVIYVTGDFKNIGGRPRAGIAALDPSSGDATAWNPAPRGSLGGPLAVTSRWVIARYGLEGNGMWRIDPTTGAATQLAQTAEQPARIDELVADAETAYGITSIEAAGPDVYRYDPVANGFDSWSLAVSSFDAEGGGGFYFALTPSNGHLYAAGDIDLVGDTVTGPLAQLDPSTGAASPTVVTSATR